MINIITNGKNKYPFIKSTKRTTLHYDDNTNNKANQTEFCILSSNTSSCSYANMKSRYTNDLNQNLLRMEHTDNIIQYSVLLNQVNKMIRLLQNLCRETKILMKIKKILRLNRQNNAINIQILYEIMTSSIITATLNNHEQINLDEKSDISVQNTSSNSYSVDRYTIISNGNSNNNSNSIDRPNIINQLIEVKGLKGLQELNGLKELKGLKGCNQLNELKGVTALTEPKVPNTTTSLNLHTISFHPTTTITNPISNLNQIKPTITTTTTTHAHDTHHHHQKFKKFFKKIRSLIMIYNILSNHQNFLIEYLILYLCAILDNMWIYKHIDYCRVLYLKRLITQCKMQLLHMIKEGFPGLYEDFKRNMVMMMMINRMFKQKESNASVSAKANASVKAKTKVNTSASARAKDKANTSAGASASAKANASANVKVKINASANIKDKVNDGNNEQEERQVYGDRVYKKIKI